MNKTVTITTILILLVSSYVYFLKIFDQMPSEYKTLKKIELDIRQKHTNIISKLSSDSQVNKRGLASDYLIDSKLWLVELQELVHNYKKIGKGLSMRIRSRLAGEALEIKNQIKLIEQTRIMLQNALTGKVLSDHERLLNFDKDKAYRKIFKSIPSKSKTGIKKL